MECIDLLKRQTDRDLQNGDYVVMERRVGEEFVRELILTFNDVYVERRIPTDAYYA